MSDTPQILDFNLGHGRSRTLWSDNVYTIGYGGRAASSVIDQLRKADIQFLIDIRSSPYSRHQPEFSREELEGTLGAGGIRYVYMGDLLGGIPREPDCYTNGQVDYAKCRSKGFFRKGMERLRHAHSQGLHICLLCSEAKPWHCHRSKLVGLALQEEGINVVHLLADGSSCSQREAMLKLTSDQGDFFGAADTSRKVYR